MPIKATNEFVFIIRDATETEKAGLFIPAGAREKPHTGTIVSVGQLVKDNNIKSGKGKRVLFHRGVGFEIPFEDQTYLVLNAHEIIGIV